MITILIPTIGRSDLVMKALLSAHNTSVDLVRQIVILDNSQSREFNDLITKAIAEFRDDRFSIAVYPLRKSMAQSWNDGLLKVAQPWVLYLHDDDELIYGAIDSINHDLLDQCDTGFVSFDYRLVTEKFKRDIKRNIVSEEDMIISIIENCPKFVSTLINTAKLKEIGGWSDPYGNFLDLVAFLELYVLAGAKFKSIVIGVYLKHEGNESNLSKREAGYGDSIPVVTAKCFTILKSKRYRRALLEMYTNYVYERNDYPLVCTFLERLNRFIYRCSRAR